MIDPESIGEWAFAVVLMAAAIGVLSASAIVFGVAGEAFGFWVLSGVRVCS